MARFMGDGLIVATPAGSAAYNLWAHGPIIPLGSNLLAVTPVSPFRPRRWKGALVPHTAEIVVENLDADKRPLAATADFHELFHVVAVTIGEDTSTTVLPVVREVRDQYINIQQPPASTAVEVRRLVRDDLLIEVEAVAAIASFQPMTATA